MSADRIRLKDPAPWRKWGPYLGERQWGTVREDYSKDGAAWEYVSHDASRSKAYRWGEDGIGGFCDDRQRLNLSVALWNGKDPILKERFFGLTGNQGNHGEDVKEYYAYVDALPSHSYLKMLYKYPQNEFPYAEIENETKKRTKKDPEYELLDTKAFDDNRYFDVFIEYAKVNADDFFMKVTAINRGPEEASVVIIPQIFFRNTWAWDITRPKPFMARGGDNSVELFHRKLGSYNLYFDGAPDVLFTENETNFRRLYGIKDAQGYFKDAFHDYVINGQADAVNPIHTGTKAGFVYRAVIPAGGSYTAHLRLTPDTLDNPFSTADETFKNRIADADEFYNELQHDIPNDDAKMVQRQAFAGLIWTKQFYYYDIRQWMGGDPSQPTPPANRQNGRNSAWKHMRCADVISMPDKWEYPWFAAWDLAFHCIPFAMIDPAFAKDQLLLLTKDWYMHPNGQLPAYEWAFSDANPPVHAWASWRVYKIEKKQNGGVGDLAFLEQIFLKLMINFTWWVNRHDRDGHNIFQGGFLGLDNIGVFDRNTTLPTGGYIEQADGTAWMAMYALNMMTMALELAKTKPFYEDLASRYFEHFLTIADAMMNMGEEGVSLWDEEDEFYYDILNPPEGAPIPLKLRSLVGLIPLFAVETLEPDVLSRAPRFKERLEWFLTNRPHMASLVSRWFEPGKGERRLLSLLRGHRMKALLRRMLDEKEFLSEFGIRALSKVYDENPFVFPVGEATYEVKYQPGESDSAFFGGNSNWRGPIWFPTNFLLIESLQKFYHYYGDDFTVEYPTGSGKLITLNEVANEISRRLTHIFLRNSDGNRAVFGAREKVQKDPHFRDYVMFYEYFHGDNGSGIGAGHQCGWTALITKLLQPRFMAKEYRQIEGGGR